ncbi:hypothetical protein [Shewanella surugensis]|uniref:Uncharacterized protein n=1 Tax=Shewanella surugensis TaxID=212020 RepID=A0ABT0LA20_9GAMM|nr:hypothetical protein [Shewanella surugensis]MCL1124563.1 hypothetical protein [Shewanella surugensis]
MHRLGRIVTRDTLIGDTLLEKGKRVFLLLGAALGRLETEIAIAALIEHFSQGNILEPPEYIHNLGLRAMKSLKIRL